MSLSFKERLRRVSLIFAWVTCYRILCRVHPGMTPFLPLAAGLRYSLTVSSKTISKFQEAITDLIKVMPMVSSRLVSILMVSLGVQPIAHFYRKVNTSELSLLAWIAWNASGWSQHRAVLTRIYGSRLEEHNYGTTVRSVAFAGTVVGMVIFGSWGLISNGNFWYCPSRLSFW